MTFPTDLPSTATAGKRVLIGSQGLAALGVVAPDYVMPDGFLATDGATLNYAGVDQVSYAPLPADGINAINRTGVVSANVATNFAGAAAAVPALPVTAVEFRHAGLDHYFISDLQPDIDALDSGRIAGWVRTGQSFKVFANPDERRRESGVPLFHSARARRFPLLLGVACRMRVHRAIGRDRSQLQRVRPRIAGRILRRAARYRNRRLSQRHRARVPALEPARRTPITGTRRALRSRRR